MIDARIVERPSVTRLHTAIIQVPGGPFGIKPSGQKTEPYRIGGGLGAVGASGFRQNIMDMGCDRALADRESQGDVGIAPANGKQAKDVELSPGEVVRGRRFWRRFRQALPGQGNAPAERGKSQHARMSIRRVQKRRRLGPIGGIATCHKHLCIVATRVLPGKDGADPVVHCERLFEMPLRIRPTPLERSK